MSTAQELGSGYISTWIVPLILGNSGIRFLVPLIYLIGRK